MTDSYLYSELLSLPTELKKEVRDFIMFLKNKSNIQNQRKQRKFGAAKGFFKIKSNFDDPIEDFKDYM